MGGYGSGGHNALGRRTTSATLRLDVNLARRRGCLEPGWSGSWGWTWTTGERSSIRIEAGDDAVVLRFTVRANGGETEPVVQHVPVVWEPCRFGGARPFWLCPGCGRRIVILYGVRRFACRACHRLAYASQRERGPDRAQRRANGIRRRLDGEPGFDQVPPKPPRMHRRTYDRLIERVLAADLETETHLTALLARTDRPKRRGKGRGGCGT